MATPDQPQSLDDAISDLKFGNFDQKVKAVITIYRIKPSELERLRPEIEKGFLDADGLGEQLFGAWEIARERICIDPVVQVLLHAVNASSPRTVESRAGRCMALDGLSYLKNEPRIVDALTQLSRANFVQGDYREGDYAMWALGAIGAPDSKPLLEQAAASGNRAAKAALSLFGTGTWNEIQEANERLKQMNAEKESAPKEKSKAGSCFVATAVFQDPTAREVRLLQSFRDSYLSEYWLGRQAIALYSSIGPHLAVIVRRHPKIQRVLRGMISALVERHLVP